MPHPNYVNIESLRLKIGNDSINRIRGAGQSAWGNLDDEQEMPEPALKRILPLFLALFWKPEAPQDKRNLDLVAVNPPPNLDNFTRWVSQDFVPFYHDHVRDPLRNIMRCLCQWNGRKRDSDSRREEKEKVGFHHDAIRVGAMRRTCH
jgi:hypothetical protein